MNKCLYIFLSFLAFQACRNNAHEETFQIIDTAENNQQIRRATEMNEKWAEEPLTIINKFYRPEYYDIALNTTYNVSLLQDSKDHYTATVQQEGFKDIPVAGIKVIMILKWNNPGWSFQSIKKAYKCNNGSRTPLYSKDSCK